MRPAWCFSFHLHIQVKALPCPFQSSAVSGTPLTDADLSYFSGAQGWDLAGGPWLLFPSDVVSLLPKKGNGVRQPPRGDLTWRAPQYLWERVNSVASCRFACGGRGQAREAGKQSSQSHHQSQHDLYEGLSQVVELLKQHATDSGL